SVTITSGSFGQTSTAAGKAIQTAVSSLSVSATNGAIFVREADAVTLTNLAATGAGNGVSVESVGSGDISVTPVSSAAGDASIKTDSGSILGSSGANSISGGLVTLNASSAGEIGQPATFINTTATSWNLNAADGSTQSKQGIWVSNSAGVIVNSATTTNG